MKDPSGDLSKKNFLKLKNCCIQKVVIFYVFDIPPAFFVCTSESKERGGPLNNLLSGDS